MTGLTMEQQRDLTLGVIQWLQRQTPIRFAWADAQKALDHFARAKPDTVASVFWLTCSDRQRKLLRRDFRREWTS